MPTADDHRRFAVDVVRRLREAGYEAVWAGGCVRDRLLGLEPKDYDVATSATPDEVRAVFGRRQTIAIGAAFGVIAVLAPKGISPVEVATFRRDVGYSDGRRPDAVAFTTAEEDAQRRDFTINGLFYDPLDDCVLDFVGGQEDLKRRIVRAIGDPAARFTEDKLRMLRAVRIAATFDFAVDPATMAAIRTMAADINVVSAERIAAELRRMLVHPNRRRAIALLAESGLLAVMLPEAGEFAQPSSPALARARRLVEALQSPSFALALGTVFYALSVAEQAATIGRRWRLSNDEIDCSHYVAAQAESLDAACQMPWSQLQRRLIHPFAADVVALHAARRRIGEGSADAVAFCQDRLAWPLEQLDPPPLVTGEDLKSHGVRPGPQFKHLLDRIRDAQLDGQILDRNAALLLVDRFVASPEREV